MALTVKDMAEMTGLSPHTIRYYLHEGLLPAVERDGNGTHVFRESDLESFYMIECMKSCGMTIAQIREYLAKLMEGDAHIDEFIALFEDQLVSVQQKIDRLQECKESVEYKVWYYKKAKEAGTISVHECMEIEDVPPRMARIRANMANVRNLTEGD